MKKYKHFILGLVIGIVLMSILPVSAAIEEYILYKSDCKLVINGTDWQDSDLPMLNYKGYNYLPAAAFRQISEQIGATFVWNNTTKKISITATTKTEETPDGVKIDVERYGENYVGIYDIYQKYSGIQIKFRFFRINPETGEEIPLLPSEGKTLIELPRNELALQLIKEDVLVLNNIPFKIVDNSLGFAAIEYNYYKNTMLPLLH